jgi:hypothetical protein
MKAGRAAVFVFGALRGIAALGLLLSVAAHLSSLLGIPLPMRAILGLHGGLFVVWVPLVMSGLVFRWHGMEVIGFPRWWHRAFKWSLVYAGVHFAIAVMCLAIQRNASEDARGTAPYMARLLSAGWMLFYGTAVVGFDARRRTLLHAIAETGRRDGLG